MFSARQRWQEFFLRLNEVEGRSDDPERVLMARTLMACLSEDVPSHVVLRPGDEASAETGPDCVRCERELRRAQLLVACTVCLRIAHHECWRRSAGCPSPACVEERHASVLPYRQPLTRRSG
jgi:hypothetical protein